MQDVESRHLKSTVGGIVAPERILPAGGLGGERPPMGPQAIGEYAVKMTRRYQRADRAGRGQLLDEFTAVTGMHRKYVIAPWAAVRSGRPSDAADHRALVQR